ncbi:cation channel sperm-associated protein 1 [Paroedura picta]|uniref:cation channel sperm-associated protein 1 n=1 Tax=Paroedura picta TaxID=143630 RepID=UPI0040564857
MDYLTVPVIPSTSTAMEKPLAKEEPQTQAAASGVMSHTSAFGMPAQATSTVMSITSGLSTPTRRRYSRTFPSKRWSKHSAHRSNLHKIKHEGKPHKRRGRKRKRHQRSLKESFGYIWAKVKPHLIFLRKIIQDLTQSFLFDLFIFTVVGINTILLVAQTFAVVEIRGEWFFSALDALFLSVYVVEAILKIIALDVEYFYDPWNDIDFFIMIMTVLDFMLPLIFYGQGNRGNKVTLFRVLKIFKGVRAIRAIRFLLTLRYLENFQEVTSTFMLSCRSIGAIILLMFTFLFMSSVMLRELFEEADPKHFGDLFNTIFTLFQFFTLDDWSLIYLTCYHKGAWYIIIFLIFYILVEYFLFLNLVIAVLVDNFQMALLKRQELKKQKKLFQTVETSTEEVPHDKGEGKEYKKEDEEEFFRQLVSDKYGTLELSEREFQLLYRYFQLITAIETNQQQFRARSAASDKIVDTFFEVGEYTKAIEGIQDER